MNVLAVLLLIGCNWVSGYNSMGYEMSKPDLRAELEADLKLVSEGRKDKASVLRHHVAKYKTVFIESVRKAKKYVHTVLHSFSGFFLGSVEKYRNVKAVISRPGSVGIQETF